MRAICLIIYLLSFCVLMTPVPLLANDPNEGIIQSVDIDKIRKYKYTQFIDHIFRPSDDEIVRKKISTQLISEDMQKLKNMLHTVIKPVYLLSDDVIDSNAIAVERLKKDNDYILLKYKLEKLEIQIQESQSLYISIFPDKDSKIEQSDLAKYVKSVAFQILNLPKSDDDVNEPQVFVSKLDIGNSKCGTIYYESSFPPPKFWYSHIKWWSDGKNVLLVIGKATFNGEDLNKRAGPPENLGKPRKFKKDS